MNGKIKTNPKSMKSFFLMATCMLFTWASKAQEMYSYSVAVPSWAEHLGNHRAIIQVASDAAVAHLNLEWRRHDKHPEQRRFIMVNAASNQQVPNIYRKAVNSERCELFFGPVAAGTYYFYYLPYEVDRSGGGYFTKPYLSKEEAPNATWVKDNDLPEASSSIYTEATCKVIQARTDFDSFFPMEVTSTQAEKEMLIKATSADFRLYPESRSYPIRMFDNIPQKWVNATAQKFSGTALRNEYFVFQVGLWAAKADIADVKVSFSALKSQAHTIPAAALTCFNTGGIAPSGKAFTKTIHVSEGHVQPLWMGADIPQNIPAGTYTGKLTVTTAKGKPQDIAVEIEVTGEVLADRGDSEPWRHSRLRWLNSTIGLDDNNVPQYQPIRNIGQDKLDLSGKTLSFASNGLPSSIRVFGQEVLSAPITFSILTEAGTMRLSSPKTTLLKRTTGVVSKQVLQTGTSVRLKTISHIEADGWMKYTFELEALKDVNIADILLNIPYRKSMSVNMLGIGPDGQKTPDTKNSKWMESPIFDSFWMGSYNGGLHCELRGADYTGPLLNWYGTAHPASWFNANKGGFKIATTGNVRNVSTYTGERSLTAGEKVIYECAFLVTPVKKLDTKADFTTRYYQFPGNPTPPASAIDAGVNVVNVHHANAYNPYINYPFIEVDKMKEFVDSWHAKNVKTKIYYTLRMLSNHAVEIWALRSLGSEVMSGGDGGGFMWLQEHFVDNYNVQWYARLDTLNTCNGVLTNSVENRLSNYYIEGIKWLVDQVDIDGLYLDDVAYGREMLKRIRKVVHNKKPNFMMDLHSHRGATGAPALQYAEFYPYIDKLWFGEDFHYKSMSPVNWLVETSGIPFGLMGEMLEGGGNVWRGMLYGMTARLGWTGDPTAMWVLWDSFGIAKAKMLGYWEDQSPVKTSNKDVLATTYVKNKKILVSIASWAPNQVAVNLHIDYKQLGMHPDKVQVRAPGLPNLQEARSLKIDEPLVIDPAGGLLLIIEEK